ncbi:type I restriction enzyme HsdR N-terminal domain-containing protein [Desulfonatronovibrio hydrogenovorans]|uniref:type I restriction enzyme HsdR N-terminal domain-containing protein n=1 Tax=Desulfonatronovibrio hydrogenovorans TaxID=53245 RepID=UPI00068D2784|nr:type I restriction enzyme HsdR N-terminal domain-containing protein [Desulfonatronovibrio hydrogenovorans]
MHEVSLNQVITDYLTGQEITLTTYEDIRQALARILVEEKGYPVSAIESKYCLDLDLGNESYQVILDFVIYYNQKPLIVLGFCPGAVSTYITQYVSLCRVFPQGPVPYTLVTDSKDAALIRTRDKKDLCRGFRCIPAWEDLESLSEDDVYYTLPEERLEKEKRVVYAMFALSDGCCTAKCPKPTD